MRFPGPISHAAIAAGLELDRMHLFRDEYELRSKRLREALEILGVDVAIPKDYDNTHLDAAAVAVTNQLMHERSNFLGDVYALPLFTISYLALRAVLQESFEDHAKEFSQKMITLAVQDLGIQAEVDDTQAFLAAETKWLAEQADLSSDKRISRDDAENATQRLVDHIITLWALTFKDPTVAVRFGTPPLQSVFISYGGPDEACAMRIHHLLKASGVRASIYPESSKAGEVLSDYMRTQVNKNDRVLLLCSKNSLTRPGVLNEVDLVLKREAREGGTAILIPLTLDDYVYTDWKPSRTALAEGIRERVIADFRGTCDDETDLAGSVEKIVEVLATPITSVGADK